MDQKELEYLRRIEDHAAQTGWVAPLTQEDKAYFAYLRQVSKRYNINMSKANRLEYELVQELRAQTAIAQCEESESHFKYGFSAGLMFSRKPMNKCSRRKKNR